MIWRNMLTNPIPRLTLVLWLFKNDLKMIIFLHITVRTWDWVLMSFSSALIALHETILFRSLGLTRTLTFDRVTHPPDGLVTVFVVWVSVDSVRLSTNHWIVAGGFELAVMHWKLRLSPTLASEGPISLTLAGATVIIINGKFI